MVKEPYNDLDDFKTALQQSGLSALDKIYLCYKEEFVLYSKKFDLSDEDAMDIYQDAVIIFYENVLSGKLTELTSTFKTYIFSIGKYKIFNLKKKQGKTVVLERDHYENLEYEAIDEDSQTADQVELIQQAMEKIGDRCKQILELFYYHAYTIEALMHEFDYKNENVVRSHKSRCLRNLKEVIKGL